MLSLWLLIIVFGLPVAAAWLFYLNPELLPGGRTNRGELVQPPRPLPDLSLSTLDGGNLRLRELRPHWTLITVAGPECGEHCQRSIYHLRQVRLALGEDRQRIERVLVLTQSEQPESFHRLLGDYPGMHVVVGGGNDLDRLLAQLAGPGRPPHGAVFIVDPMGNLMMRYRPDAPPKDLLSDLQALLKISKNWTKGAQYGHN
jgi:cytochrome oxidase Cu insertion factor (SCO1/SenC/PrrC family)